MNWILLLLVSSLLFDSCATIPDVAALLHQNSLYNENVTFVGSRGSLTEEQGQRILQRLEQHQETPTEIIDRHVAFEQAVSNIPLVVGNKVTLLENGTATYQAMLAAIRAAKDSINIEMFMFSDGPIGQMFADALIEREHQGVQVNLMYDSLGSFGTSSAFFNRLRQNGIAVLAYRPLNPFATRVNWTLNLNHRNHRKMLIVDGRIAFTGGINISEVYASGLGSREVNTSTDYWRDTDIELEGPAVAEVQRIFISEWSYQAGPLLSYRNYFPQLTPQGRQIVRVIATVPERFSLIYVTLISAISNAETNVYITDAYFDPDDQILHALERAARRGVDVRLLFPSQSDEALIVPAERSHYKALLKSGVKIYEWQGEMLHSKTATIDGVWSTVGTSNLDWWSIARDNELNVIILGHSVGDEMNLMFEDDLKNSRQVMLNQWKHRGLQERIKEIAAEGVQELL